MVKNHLMRKSKYMISIILLCSGFLFSQNIIDISSVGCDSEQRNIDIPILGGNLKPEFQPPWDDSEYLDKLDALEIQMLRWPGAEASNFFSWYAGTFIPCYKWEESPCIPHNSAQSGSSYCQDPICESNGINYYARDYQTDANGDSTLLDGCSKSVNISSNFASNYIKATQEDLQKQLFPLFVLNVISPDYYYIDENFIDNHINPTTCLIEGNGTYDEGEEFVDLNLNGVYNDGEEFFDAYPTKVNSIQAQMDSICYVIEEFNLTPSNVRIQLSNEPWHDHDYKFDIWQNGGDYAQDMIEAAEIIRATLTPSGLSCGQNIKIGLSGDVHSYNICNDAECEDRNINSIRCDWNSLMWQEIESQGKTNLFDAVSFQEYGGIRKMKIPDESCFDLASGELNEDCDLEEDDSAWRNVRWLNTGYGFLFREFGEQAGGTPPSTDPEYNTIIMNYFNKWLPLQVDRNLNTLNGETIDWEDEETIEQCGDGYGGLYPELLHNLDKEVWITEYEPLLLDGENLYLRPYQGGWPHAVLFLYSTLGYITETSNLKVLINNNVNGFAGNYRLIDSYSYADNVNGTNQCKYICDGGGCNEDDERDLCKNKYPFLSPKGELMRLLNQLAWKNNQIEKINFGEEIGTTHIKRFDFPWNYYPKDLYGWKFSDKGTYSSSDGCLEADDHDYLFINVSENEYHINFDDCDAYAYQVKKSDNMFAKNYHHDNAAVYTTVPYSNQGQDGDVVFTWEFTHQADYNYGGFFEGTDKISQDFGLINSNSEDSVLVIPPSSVVQVMSQGSSNEDECGVCGGSGIPDGQCDCDGNVEDCAGECAGSAELDGCGVCAGDNSTCTGCMDETACNYDDCNGDGVPGDPCTIDNNELCTSPEGVYLDCEGNCINDSNGDGICDELSLFGGLIPEEYNLHSIYPNPFNPVTNIIYGLPEYTKVHIIIYNISGQPVITLVNEYQTPGYYSTAWNADGYPSGIYFVNIIAGEYVNTQKLMLVK